MVVVCGRAAKERCPTAGCYSADEAVRTARLGREILLSLENPGADWVKLEVLGDKKTLLPDPVGTLEAL